MSNPLLAATRDGDKAIRCRPVKPAELHAAAAMLLGATGRPASNAQVVEFIQSTAQRRIDLNSIWVAESGGQLIWAALPVVSPGKTLLLLASSQITDGGLPAAVQLVGELCDYFGQHDVHLAQVLIEPQQAMAQRFFAGLGFVEIAELIYLQGYIPRAAKSPQMPQQMRFLAYSPESHGLFADAILQSYRDSLDCPALSGLRDIEDIIAGHQSTGDHDPAMWQLLTERENPLGVLLLSRILHTDAVELVYLGLRPEARGRGLGTLLMQRAMHLILADHRRSLSLAVDSKNEPALKLYYSHGMQRIAARLAMIRDLRNAK
ncbi:MAG TPA: GNAT family N-acetyltransferase [Tepidisphaeraceae bacterium]|jgi:ribosomal protein S18 acetylase RimI-like enzyme|nr:GNAT family N-acetyltransferase [Tepidisphaeraceae bacterium]